MIGAGCQAVPGGGFVGGILDYVDCQAQTIGAGGYLALGAPGSTLSLLVTGLLTLFVALFGYRMLLGRTPGMSDGILSIAKVGIVLALAFSWPAYRTLVYDIALHAPAELAAEVGRPAGLPGSEGGLVERLDNADRALVALGVLGTGAGTVAPAVGPGTDIGRQPSPAFDPIALGGARFFYLAGAVGALAALRLIAGLMLALGPFFIAFLLFESTRGLFEGWVRVLAGAALGALGTAIVLGVELALIEPWLAQLLAWRTAGYAIAGVPTELFVVSFIFSLCVFAMVIASWRLTVGFALPVGWRAAPGRIVEAMRSQDERSAVTIGADAAAVRAAGRSRADAVADAVAVSRRRETVRAVTGPEMPERRVTPHDARREPPLSPFAHHPLAVGQRRRTRGRISASAARRDKGA